MLGRARQRDRLLGGRFRVVEELGRGGMGVVYEVRDAELGEHVALKLLLGEEGRRAADRMRQEVRLARRITHPNVVRLFDIGEDDGEPFFTMELVRGQTLHSVMRASQLDLQDATRYALGVARGLAAAHAAGVVHRDLKPANVLVGDERRVVLTDFGIARAARGDAPDEVSGTEGYMSPEQEQGEPETAATDVFSFGVVLAELLTGDTREHALTETAFARVPEPLSQLVRACTDAQPERRPSANELVERLEGKGTTVRTAVPPVRKTEKSVAVLPPRIPGGTIEAEAAETLTDEWVDALTRTAGLRVVGLAATRRFTERRDPLEVGAALHVDAVVDAALRRTGSRIRVDARLHDAMSGQQLWSERFEDDMGALLQIQETMATRIAEALRVALAVVSNRGAVEADVFDHYVQGRAAMHRFELGGPEGALSLLREVVRRAPEFSPGRAALATASVRAWYTGISSDQETARVQAIVQDTLARAGDLAESHLAMALLHRENLRLAEAAASLSTAVSMAPTYSLALEVLAAIQCETGHEHLGMPRAEQALELDPRLSGAYGTLIARCAMRGDWEASARWCAKAAANGLGDTGAVLLSRLREAAWRRQVDVLDALRAKTPDLASHFQGLWTMLLDVAQQQLPRARLVELVADRMQPSKPLPPARRAFLNQMLAEGWAAAGDVEQALMNVAQAVESGLADVGWLNTCPALAVLRQHGELNRFRNTVEGYASRVWAG